MRAALRGAGRRHVPASLPHVLEELRIRGLGVIDDAVLPLGRGLTVVTGETGAGKTMVVTGLLLLFGGRADAARVRSGVERASIDGRLEIDADSRRGRASPSGGRGPRRRHRAGAAARRQRGRPVAGLRRRRLGPGGRARRAGRATARRARAGRPAPAHPARPTTRGARPVRRRRPRATTPGRSGGWRTAAADIGRPHCSGAGCGARLICSPTASPRSTAPRRSPTRTWSLPPWRPGSPMPTGCA